jgi:hypothetical protein
MAVGANNNQLKVAADKMAVMAAAATAIAAGTNSIQLKAVVEKTAVVAVVVAMAAATAMATATAAKTTIMATTMAMMTAVVEAVAVAAVVMGVMMSAAEHLATCRQEQRSYSVNCIPDDTDNETTTCEEGGGWATMQRHLPSLAVVAAAMYQPKLTKDNGGQSPREVVGRNGPD